MHSHETFVLEYRFRRLQLFTNNCAMLVKENISLSKYTTMRVGGPARFFVSVKTILELASAIKFSKEKNIQFFIIGCGSNIIISDNGFAGLVIKLDLRGVEFEDYRSGKVLVIARAGEIWDCLVRQSVNNKLFGIENLSLIPGTVGAAPIQNIGAYGTELSETLEWVEIFDTETFKISRLGRSDCGFEYRDSIFKNIKNKNLIITGVALALLKNGIPKTDYKDVKEYLMVHSIANPTISDMREVVISIRKKKFPNDSQGTAGSFFKNPIVNNRDFNILKQRYPDMPFYGLPDDKYKIPLAWILDYICDLKGKRIGNIGVYKNQPLVLVNYGDASAMEICKFAEKIKKDVFEKTKIIIEYEVRFIGEF